MEISYERFVVLEDFHYLPGETQKDLAFSLKAFHEKSRVTFVVVGVWREENRLLTFNGDLTDRVFAVDVDAWNNMSLQEVIQTGGQLLNVQFSEHFVKCLLDGCFNSVHIVQEVCRRCLRNENVFSTCDRLIILAHLRMCRI